jgi:hypothetical protein
MIPVRWNMCVVTVLVALAVAFGIPTIMDTGSADLSRLIARYALFGGAGLAFAAFVIHTYAVTLSDEGITKGFGPFRTHMAWSEVQSMELSSHVVLIGEHRKMTVAPNVFKDDHLFFALLQAKLGVKFQTGRNVE